MNPNRRILLAAASCIVTSCNLMTTARSNEYDHVVESFRGCETPCQLNGILEGFDHRYLDNHIVPLTPGASAKRFLIYNKSVDSDLLIELTVGSGELTKKDLVMSLVTKSGDREKVTLEAIKFFRFGERNKGFLEQVQ